ncbi:MAG: hypothetical protein U1E46_16150 [Hyphomicrobiales bacterium]
MADQNWQTDVRQGDYEEIEEAVLETQRGRWFLAEFARRNRTADTRMLLEAMGRLERVVANRLEATTAQPALSAPELEKAKAEIAALRQDNLDNGGALPAGADPFAATAAAAAEAATGIVETTQALQALAASLREKHPDEPLLDQIDAAVGKLHREGWKSDLASRRVAVAMGVLARAGAPAARPVAQLQKPTLEPRNLKYFAADEELFQPIPLSGKPRISAAVEAIANSETFHFHAEQPAVAQPAAETKDEKKRIVIVRRAPGEGDIPLEPESPPEASKAN